MLNQFFLRLFFVVIVCISTINAAFAENDEKAYRIVLEADKRATGYIDSSSKTEMILIDQKKREKKKSMVNQVKEYDAGDRSVITFIEPAENRGTALLVHGKADEDDDQWLYLPRMKRTKKISSNNKTGSFLGSEFSFEDLSDQDVDDFTYTWLKEENLNGLVCDVIERTPINKKSFYSKHIVWIDKTELRTQKIEYYNRRGELYKTMTFNGYRLHDDNRWRPDQMVMVNHSNDKSTIMNISEFATGVGLTDNTFSISSLSRGR